MGSGSWIGVVAIAGVAGLYSVVVLRRRHALRELTRRIAALEQGGRLRPLLGRFLGSLGGLIRTFNEVSPRLGGRLASLESDLGLFQTVLDGMSEGVLAVDSRRRLLFANAGARRLFGLEADCVGRLLAEAVRSPRFHQLVERALRSDQPCQEEITIADGGVSRIRVESITLAVHGVRLPESSVTGAVLVFHDVTELRRLERMRQDFVANASHELKTPLASIQAYTETLLDGALHDETVNVGFLQRIGEQADRLNQLILDMLSLSRLERGQDAFVHEPLCVAPIIASIVDAHRARAKAKKQQLLLRTGNLDDSVHIHIDAEALRQILDNLIDNAIKYTPPSGRVAVSCTVGDDKLEIDVSDTGAGIPRDELPRVFERFYRVDQGRGRDVGGTGLGLAIVKHLVQSLGGHVSVRSRTNAGSTFTVSLPRCSSPHQTGAVAEPALTV